MKSRPIKKSDHKIRPTIRRSDVTHFYGLSDDEFERLCCDLHGKQKGITTCNLYGSRGQSDKGVDHIAGRESGSGNEVGQSKCCREFSERDIRDAVTPFFEYLVFWKEQDVRRYILFVACETNRTQIHDEKENQRKLFAEQEIVFELWSGRDIERHLLPHRDIVEKYLPSKEIQDKICGSREPDIIFYEKYRTLELNYEALSSQRTGLSDAFSEATHQLVEQLRETYRRGKRREALQGIQKLFNDSEDKWLSLDQSTRGQMLRIMALYTLNVEDNLEAAVQLADRATREDPDGDDATIKATIAYKKDGRDGIEEALSLARSSSSIEALNLQASLLIEMGRYEDALWFFNESSLDLEENAETHRLKGLAYLCSGRLLDARVHIESALERKADWHSIKFARSLIDYWTAFSSSALHFLNPLIPVPVSFDMIKRDQDSLDSLDRAEKGFAELESNQQIPEEERKRICLWRLASLAVHPDKQDEAEKYCFTLLDKWPSDSLLIRWALSKNYGIDRDALTKNIIERLEMTTEAKDLDLVTILIGLLLEKHDHYGAFNILDKYRKPFEAVGHLDIWLYWRAQTIITSGGKLGTAKKAISDILNSQLRAQLTSMILEIECRQRNNWVPLVLHYESAYGETGNVLNLLEACRLKASLKDYNYVLSKGEELINVLGTPAAVYLVADCAWRAKKSETCLKLLEQYRGLFPKGILPPDLRRLSVICERELGLLPEALQKAKDLVLHSGLTQDIMTLMHVQLDYGDLGGMKECALKLAGRDDALPADLLSAANIMQLTDIALARLLFEKALKCNIGADLVGVAIDVGFRLGLESEIHPLLTRMQELARKGEGGSHVLTFRQIVELQKSQSERAQNVKAFYDKGQMPVHFVSEQLHVPLSLIYHEILSEHEQNPSPLTQPPVLVRFGNRHLKNVPKIDGAKCQLYLDITALLLSAHLGIIEILERVFPVLHISSETQPFLIQEIKNLTHNQPSRLDACRKVKELVDLHNIQVMPLEEHVIEPQDPFHVSMGADWVSGLLVAMERGGFVVDFLPLHSHNIDTQPVSIPEEYRDFITGIGVIVEGLAEDQIITEGQRRQFIESLSSVIEDEVDSPRPGPGASLYLMGGIAGTLAEAGILSIACQRYQILISESEINTINAEITQEKRNSRLRSWLDKLRDKIKIGLDMNKYKGIVRGDLSENLATQREPRSPSLTILGDLLSLISDPGDIVWYDDRYLSSYSTNNNGGMIVGITDILTFLKTKMEITEDFYHQKLIELRSSNVRYIPLSGDEISYHLKKAEIQRGQLLETQELSILRRYWAACLLDSDRLQCSPSQGDNKHELGFLVWSIRAVQEAITQCFADDSISNDVANIRSDWLFFNMYTGIYGIKHLMHDPDPTSDRFDLIGIDLSGMLTAAIGLQPKLKKETESQQDRYLHWLKFRFITDQLKVNPEAIVSAASVLKSILSDLISERKGLTEKHHRIEKSLIVQLLLGMPIEILHELDKEPGFLDRFGVRYARSINIKGITFRGENYWSTAAKAAAGTPQTLNADKPSVILQVEWVLDHMGRPSLVLKSVDGKFNVTNSDPLLGVLSEDMQVRLDALKRSREDLDCYKIAYTKMKEDITIIQNPVDRIEYMIGHRERSYAFFCRSLLQRLIDQDSVNMNDLLPPSLKSILNHCRLEILDFAEHTDFPIAFSQMVDRLAEEYIPAETIDRLGCVPVLIPEVIYSLFDTLTPVDRKTIFGKAAERWFSPVSLLHLLKLSLYYARYDETLLEIAKAVYKKLWKETGKNLTVEIFLNLLKHFEAEFSNWREFRDLPVRARLFCIWTHASRICNLFGEAGADIEMLANYIDAQRSTSTYMLFYHDKEYLQDVLNPSHVSLEHFTCHALPKVIVGIDKRYIDSLSVKVDITNLIKDFFEGKKVKALSLLRDTTLQKDSLSSLFGGDRGSILKEVLGEEMSGIFSTVSLRETAEKRVYHLKEDPYSMRDWMDLAAIVSDLPMYDDLVNKFLSVVETVNLEEFYLSDRTGFGIALPMICTQTALFGSEELFEKIANAIVNVTAQVEKNIKKNKHGEKNGYSNKEDIRVFLVNAIYMMSHRKTNTKESSMFFSQMTERMLRISPRLCQNIYYALANLATQLPASQMHGIWKLVLVSRALSQIKPD